ncbi:TonB-dependent receptor [Mangrovibacterium diazotrophicum]|nr:TonB-dependent receptor [Mangrovibacterium diazotrophicum]
MYDNKQVDVNRRVSIEVQGKNIDEVLADIFAGTNVSYKVIDRHIMLVANESHSSNMQQSVKVTGKVADKSGQPLPGVTVMIKGTTQGTITDFDGVYTLDDVPGDGILVFSFVGMRSQEIPIMGQSTIDATLQDETIGLEEVVAIGYGTQKRATLTGSIAEVKGQELKRSPQPNLSNSLAGKFSGVIINNRSGEPGYDDSNFYVRGLATTGNNDVLVVVDGVPGQIGGLSRLDPNDIESLTILKDASAAVYGSRAANGVILVTTKRGESGKPTLTYSFNYGLSLPTRLPDMADAATYAEIMNEIDYYNNPDGGMNQFYSEAEIQKFRDGSDPLNYPNTNWAKETLRNATPQTKHNISLTGGSESLKYFVSIGRLSQDGLYKDGVTKYEQSNIRTNIDADITDRLTFGVSISGRKEDRRYPIASAGDIFRSIYRAYPTVAARFPNGLPTSGIENNNPILMATDIGGVNNNPTYVLNTILKASYEIPKIKGLTVDGVYALDNSWSFSKAFSKPYSVYDYDSSSDSYSETITGGSAGKAMLTEGQENTSLTTASLKLNYEKRWGEHQIKALAGYEQSENKQETFEAIAYNFPTTETPELSQGGSASTDKEISGSSYKYTRRSYFGRLAYDYKEKYMLEGQMRVDGSSIFPEGERYGFFPAISAGWRISQESWFADNVNFMQNLKLRASYGELGNDNVDQFQYYNNFSFNNQYVIGSDVHEGIDLVKLANPNITWEVAKKTDIALEGLLFDGFSFEFIYFQQNRSNILAAKNASIPSVSGIVNGYDADPLVPYENIGKIDNKGFELNLGYKHRQGDFSYNIAGNLTYAKNKVIFVDEAAGTLDYQKETGKTLNSYLLYNVIGIFRTQDDLDNNPHLSGAQLGDLIYEDYDKNGEITADDQVRSKYSNIPEITFGLNLSANWKNFDFSMVFAGQAKVSQYVLPESGTVGNFYSSWADNRWSPTNINGSYPRVDTRASSSINGGLYQNNFWLNDASFVRLKNLEVGYTVPNIVLSKINIKDVRFYVSGFNLFTITGVKDYDPEGSSESGQFYPQQKIFNFGINVKF